jgi:hypothetical protein
LTRTRVMSCGSIMKTCANQNGQPTDHRIPRSTGYCQSQGRAWGTKKHVLHLPEAAANRAFATNSNQGISHLNDGTCIRGSSRKKNGNTCLDCSQSSRRIRSNVFHRKSAVELQVICRRSKSSSKTNAILPHLQPKFQANERGHSCLFDLNWSIGPLMFFANATARRLLLNMHHKLAAGHIIQRLHGCRGSLELGTLRCKQPFRVAFRAHFTDSILFAAVAAFSGSFIKTVVIGILCFQCSCSFAGMRGR